VNAAVAGVRVELAAESVGQLERDRTIPGGDVPVARGRGRHWYRD